MAAWPSPVDYRPFLTRAELFPLAHSSAGEKALCLGTQNRISTSSFIGPVNGPPPVILVSQERGRIRSAALGTDCEKGKRGWAIS